MSFPPLQDRECVDEVLALEQDRLKFAKRKLRVQRCKTLPGAPKLRPSGQKSSGASQQKSRSDAPIRSHTASTIPVSVPKGDPTLGNKIAGLSKEERKKVKSTDADRVARRLAKKKAKSLPRVTAYATARYVPTHTHSHICTRPKPRGPCLSFPRKRSCIHDAVWTAPTASQSS